MTGEILSSHYNCGSIWLEKQWYYIFWSISFITGSMYCLPHWYLTSFSMGTTDFWWLIYTQLDKYIFKCKHPKLKIHWTHVTSQLSWAAQHTCRLSPFRSWSGEEQKSVIATGISKCTLPAWVIIQNQYPWYDFNRVWTAFCTSIR